MWDIDAAELAEHLVPVMTIWREASGQGVDGMAGVAWVILNRMKRRRQTAEQVCLAKWQFSSMNGPGDQGMTHWPGKDPAFRQAYIIWRGCLDGTIGDPTDGADLYYATSIKPPEWAAKATFTVQIKDQRFFKDV